MLEKGSLRKGKGLFDGMLLGNGVVGVRATCNNFQGGNT